MSGSRLADRALLVVEAAVGLTVVGAIIGKSYGIAPTFFFLGCGAAAAFSVYALVRMVGSLNDRALDLPGRTEDTQRAKLEHEKRLVLQGIKELEADYAIGKVDPGDYAHLRGTYESRALTIMGALKAEDERWLRTAQAVVEQRLGKVAAKTMVEAPDGVGVVVAVDETERWKSESGEQRKARTALPALFRFQPAQLKDARCTACTTENEADGRYCIGCGAPLEKKAA